MKTTIQNLIDDLKVIESRGTSLTMKGIIHVLEISLYDEKKQIMTALDEGIKYGRDPLMNFDYPASRYYNETFNDDIE